jgi:hypothetical protein
MNARSEHIPFSGDLGPLFINPRRAIEDVSVRVSGWAKLGKTAAFLKQKDIRNGIEECDCKLAACTNNFMVSQPYSVNGSSFMTLSPRLRCLW